MTMHSQYSPQRPAPTASPKSPGVALILSVVVAGLGQLYTGNPVWAVFWFGCAVLCGVVFFPLAFLVIPIAAIHAYFCASGFNRRHHVVR